MGMKQTVKKIAKTVIKNDKLKQNMKFPVELYRKYIRSYNNKKNRTKFLLELISKIKVIKKDVTKGKQITKLLESARIEVKKEDKFVYSIDYFKKMATSKNNIVFGNTSLDYGKVVTTSLKDLKNALNNVDKGMYYDNQLDTINGIEKFIDRMTEEMQKKNIRKELITYLENIKTEPANGFEEALQRILFFHQLLCQTGHMLNGLGRLDKILEHVYYEDINNNKLSKEDAKSMLKEFMNTLHKYYCFKSGELMGDTGQVIILGGENSDGTYFCNELTYMFIEALKELQLPDPKILLRISTDMPEDLIKISIECIQTGIGCPLFSNDEVVIPKLKEFGYEEEDAYNYVTSACWEPLVCGKSLDPNNMLSLVYMEPMERMLSNENLDKITSREELINQYNRYLEKYLDEVFEEANNFQWELDPIFSMFTDECNNKRLDITEGGAIYNNFGFTSVSLSNTVNTILAIDELVFKQNKYTLTQLNEMKENNFEEGKVLDELRDTKLRYGKEDEEVIKLTNSILYTTSKVLRDKTNRFGGKIKYGVSAPAYITKAVDFPASFDGRKKSEPFGVHISPAKGEAYTELINFAGKLDYGQNRFNGNVVDFIVAPDFIKNNFDKFIEFIKASIKVGFFQMQMNVVSSKTLIRAKSHPEEFPNLIVRIWGFSAYFNDLPEEYKNLLIERALNSESINN